MDYYEAVAALGGAFAAGIVAALTGIGGGVIMVPVFNMLAGLPLSTAVALSLLAIVANATISSTRYIEAGLVDDKRAPLYAAGAVAGGLAGGYASRYVGEEALALAFSGLLAYTSARLVLRSTRRGGSSRGGERPPSVVRGVVVGFAAGVLAGLLGVGGGIVMIPVMVNVEGMDVKRVVATSGFVTAISASSALSTKIAGLAGLWYAPVVALSAAAGSYAGSTILFKVRREHVSLVLAVVLAVAAARMAGRALGVWG